MTENLRREGRLEARLRVYLVRGRAELALQTGDVSYRGLFLETMEPLALRSLIRLRLELSLHVVEAHAMVVHVASAAPRVGVGVEFWGLAGPQRRAWEDFVREVTDTRRAAARAAATKVDKPGGAKT